MEFEESLELLRESQLNICKNEELNPNNFTIGLDEYEQMKGIFKNTK